MSVCCSSRRVTPLPSRRDIYKKINKSEPVPKEQWCRLIEKDIPLPGKEFQIGCRSWLSIFNEVARNAPSQAKRNTAQKIATIYKKHQQTDSFKYKLITWLTDNQLAPAFACCLSEADLTKHFHENKSEDEQILIWRKFLLHRITQKETKAALQPPNLSECSMFLHYAAFSMDWPPKELFPEKACIDIIRDPSRVTSIAAGYWNPFANAGHGQIQWPPDTDPTKVPPKSPLCHNHIPHLSIENGEILVRWEKPLPWLLRLFSSLSSGSTYHECSLHLSMKRPVSFSYSKKRNMPAREMKASLFLSQVFIKLILKEILPFKEQSVGIPALISEYCSALPLMTSDDPPAAVESTMTLPELWDALDSEAFAEEQSRLRQILCDSKTSSGQTYLAYFKAQAVQAIQGEIPFTTMLAVLADIQDIPEGTSEDRRLQLLLRFARARALALSRI